MSTLNIALAILLMIICVGLLLFSENKTVGFALLPVAIANLTIGASMRKKKNG